MDAFVGKVVRKQIDKLGFYNGVVQSYDPSTKFFKIVYDDGDFEHLDFEQVSRLLVVVVSPDLGQEKLVVKRKVGRPRKRRRFRHDVETLDEIEPELDLNVGNGEIRGCIDLNLSLEDNDFDEVEKNYKKVETLRGFDLNFGFNDDLSSSEIRVEGCPDLGGDLGGSSSCKRRKVVKKLNSPVETVLRRSARRAKAVSMSELDTVSGVTDESEEKFDSLDLGRVQETAILPYKIELPPCSNNLNLDDIPVIDLFSVYSCLRSFSTLLYLSPFELEDLVEALTSKVSNMLIDFIHVSILQTLRKHLQFLAGEGCESASACLRNLNWDLLDVITWPVFMVEYLLIHGSGLKPGFTLDMLNLFDCEYYKQPTVSKLELLRCLCDDVIEVDAIKLELGKRMIMAGGAGEFDRTMINGLNKRSRISLDGDGNTCLSEDVREEVADGNSDECCLCKMDGNLICCDGCPAAYHSKCVGIVGSLLPDGDWYCPECVVGKLNCGDKPQKLIRGAELLGNDSFGRLYFSCFDYLLVSESCDPEASCNYYHKDDLIAVVQLLQSSDISYGPVLNAISQHWDIPTVLQKPKIDLEAGNCALMNEKHDGRRRRSCTVPGYSSYLLGEDTVKDSTGTLTRKTSSEGSDEVLQANQSKLGSDMACQVASTKSIASSKKWKRNNSLAKQPQSFPKSEEDDALQIQAGNGYINCYSFARTASSIVEELLRKPSDKVNIGTPTTEEQLIAIQLKFILKKSSKFSWMTVHNVNAKRQIEKCGWCYCCRFPVEGRDCLFNFTNGGPLTGRLKAEVDAVLTKKHKKGHLVDLICCILCMEERLRGFLVGPWLSPQYSELWRNSVIKASDVSSLKRPLLMLEANLRSLALSADWWKHVDSVKTVGSSFHYVAKSRVTSKNGVSKRKGRYTDSETKSWKASGGLGLLWWRGGKTSRSLFNWKVVPRPLALRAARKAGGIKIPGIQYPDSSENARRSACVAWRASVESSTCLEQLALQVRELDLVVRWDDIENAHPHSILDKASQKSIRLFKKVVVRRKCIEGSHVKFLLDFGKRRSIPDVVMKHGLKVDESSDDAKKKYWMEESYVPLHLLKNFEERRITRKAGKVNSGKARKGSRVIKKPLRRKNFDYLFSRAEKAATYQCGHCNKNIAISEAVSCKHCEGFFHKRHVTKSSDTVTAGCTYICHRCRDGKRVKTSSTGGKQKFGKLKGVKKAKVDIRGSSIVLRPKPGKKRKILGNSKQVVLRKYKKTQANLSQRNDNVYSGMTLRRSARKGNSIPLPSSSPTGGKKRKQYRSRVVASKGTPPEPSWRKRRAQVFHSFWLKGLLLSRKPNDERVVQFKRRKLFVPSDFSIEIDDPPKCTLCPEQGFISTSTYIGCETCEGWFHCDAFGLDEGNIERVIGFKCHVCLDKNPPVCPVADESGDTGALFTEAATRPSIEDAQELPEVVIHKETDCVHELLLNEISSGFVQVQTEQSSDGVLDHAKTSILDSEISVEIGSPSSKKAECQTIEIHDGLFEVLVAHKETDRVHEFHSDEISPGLVEVPTVQISDGIVDHDKTPILDSEMGVEIASPSSKEAEAQSSESHNGLPEVLVMHKDSDSVHEFHSDGISPGLVEVPPVLSSDGILDHYKTPILDSEMSVEIASPSSKEVEAHSSESHNGLPEVLVEVPTVQSSDKILDHDKTPIMDSETSVEIASPSSKEAEAQPSESQNGLPEVLIMHTDTDSAHELHPDGISPDLVEVSTVQSSDRTLDHDKTPILDSEMSLEIASPSSKEAEAQPSESQNGLPEVLIMHTDTDSTHELHLDGISPGLVEVPTVQSSDRILDHDKTPILDSEISSEIESPSSKEAEAQPSESQNGSPEVLVMHKDTNSVHEFPSYEISHGLVEVPTVQSSDGNLDHDKTLSLDSEMSVENWSPYSKEAEAQAIESENGDLRADVPKVPGDSSISEENKNISNKPKLMLIDEKESKSPASDVVEATTVESQNGALES